MITTSLRGPAVSAAFAIVLVACGGGTTPPASANATNTSSDAANIAARANEPRTGDVTARHAPPIAPSESSAAAAGTGSTATPRASKDPSATKQGAPSDGSSSTSTPTAGGATEGSTPATASPASASTVDADPPKKIGARHVLIQWMGSDRAGSSVLRTRDQALAIAQEVLKRAQAGTDLARLAVDYSDEPNAGARGGSLGRFTRGQMVPAFEQVAFKLKVGEISGIVETPFGFHIIQRTE